VKFQFTEQELGAYGSSRALSVDAEGNAVLIGLTIEETAALMEHYRAIPHGPREHDASKLRQLHALDAKHKAAMRAVHASEIAQRNGLDSE
jgi:hypothetical protein